MLKEDAEKSRTGGIQNAVTLKSGGALKQYGGFGGFDQVNWPIPLS